jgi:hypothetical protein
MKTHTASALSGSSKRASGKKLTRQVRDQTQELRRLRLARDAQKKRELASE